MSAILNFEEHEQQKRINVSLLHYVGLETGIYPKDCSLDTFSKNQAEEKIMKIREHIVANPDLVSQHAKENINNLNAEDIEIAAKFRDFVFGDFMIMSYMKKHTVFFGGSEDMLYGVHGLIDPFENFFHPDDLPVRVKTFLFPFKDKIIYDGIMSVYRIHLGKRIKATIRRSYRETKAKHGIITKL